MKYLGRVLAAAGLALSIWLFLHDNPTAIVALVRQAGLGLVVAGLIHLLPMALNARGWQVLLPGAGRPTLAAMVRLVWIRESINGLLPVARVGGEIVSFRLMRMIGVRRAPAAASLVVDMGLCMLCQVAVVSLGIGLLAAYRTDDLMLQLGIGLVIVAPVAALFIFVQYAGPFERVARFMNRFAAGKLDGVLGDSVRIDRAVRAMYRRRGAVIRSLIWQLSGCLAGAAEIWAALWLLGHPIGPTKSLAIEAVIVAVSSAGFLVPGAIGIQEGSFLMIGAVLGLDPATSLALAAARRLRDCIIFFPGLCAWHLAEGGEIRRRKPSKDLAFALKSPPWRKPTGLLSKR
jgi:putative membrane protein